MKMFGEVYESANESFGGIFKNQFLKRYSQYGVKFTDNVVLDSLVETLAEAFSYRYKRTPTVEDVKELENMRAQPDAAKYEYIFVLTTTHLYQHWMATFPREGWLVDTLREYLDKDGWPGDNTAHDRETLALNGNKRKLESDEDALDARLPKRTAHASSSRSSPAASSLCQSTSVSEVASPESQVMPAAFESYSLIDCALQ